MLRFRKVTGENQNEMQMKCYLIAGKERICFDFDFDLVVYQFRDSDFRHSNLDKLGPWNQHKE